MVAVCFVLLQFTFALYSLSENINNYNFCALLWVRWCSLVGALIGLINYVLFCSDNHLSFRLFCNDPKFSDTEVRDNSVDPDHTV